MKTQQWQFEDRLGRKTIVKLMTFPENMNRPVIQEFTQGLHTVMVQEFRGPFDSGDNPFRYHGFEDWQYIHCGDYGIEYAKTIGEAAR